MKNKILLIIIFILSLILVVIDSSSNTTIFYSTPNIKVKDNDNIFNMNLEDYVIGVVAGEMPASFNEEALKAQAVASRTYAKYKMNKSNKKYDVVTDVSNQRYLTIEEMKKKWNTSFDKYYNKIKNAVLATKGMVMYYNDEVVEAYYFALSNGYTEDSKLVFNEKRDYLQSVKVNNDDKVKNFKVTKIFKKEDICKKLNINCTNISFNNIERSSTNRVNYLTINNKKISGTTFRKKLNLRSTDFTIEEKNNLFYITTKGYGHGVGMSQYGANNLAKDGYSYQEILTYFYKNIKINSI